MSSGRRFLLLLLATAMAVAGLAAGDDASGVPAPAAPPKVLRAHANHILVETEAEADAILDELSKSTRMLVDFARLAKDKSKCPSGKKGGDLGSFERGRMVPEFDSAVFDREPKTLYKVQTQFGWHVIYTIRIGEAPEDEDSGYRTLIYLLNKAMPFLGPLILIAIMVFGQRSTIKISGVKARASHILVDTEKEVDELLEQIQAAAEPKKKFAELAAARSKCPSKRKGGDLGLFGKGQMVPPFEKVAFEKDVGSMHKVQTQFGWHVVMVTDRLGDKKKEN